MNTSRLYDLQRPYYMKARLTATFDDSGTAPSPNPDVVKSMVEQFNGTNSNHGNWDSTNNYWLCPKTGIYKVYGHVLFEARNNDRLHFAKTLITVNDTVTAESQLDLLTGTAGHDDDMDTVGIGVTTILSITQNQQVKLKYSYTHDTTTGVHIKGDSAIDKTFILIERIE